MQIKVCWWWWDTLLGTRVSGPRAHLFLLLWAEAMNLSHKLLLFGLSTVLGTMLIVGVISYVTMQRLTRRAHGVHLSVETRWAKRLLDDVLKQARHRVLALRRHVVSQAAFVPTTRASSRPMGPATKGFRQQLLSWNKLSRQLIFLYGAKGQPLLSSSKHKAHKPLLKRIAEAGDKKVLFSAPYVASAGGLRVWAGAQVPGSGGKSLGTIVTSLALPGIFGRDMPAQPGKRGRWRVLLLPIQSLPASWPLGRVGTRKDDKGEVWWGVILQEPRLQRWLLVEIANPAPPPLSALAGGWPFLLFLGLVVGALASLFHLSRNIAQPVRLLTEVMEQIARGQLHMRAGIQSSDEFGQLAHHLNQMAEQLAGREQRLKDILDTASDAILSVNLASEIVMFNSRAEELFGYEAEEVLGQPLGLLLPQRFRGVHAQHVHRFADEAGSRRLMDQRSELEGRRQNGQSFPVEVSISKMTWEGEWLFTAIVRDVTERKEAEQALKEANDMLEQRVEQRTAALRTANDELRSFTYIVSHDLRSPLVNLKGFAGELAFACDELRELLVARRPELSPQEQGELYRIMEEEIPESLAFINSSSSRMEALINAILSLSRAGYRKLHYEEVSLAEVVDETLKTLQHQIEQQGASVVWEPAQMPLLVVDRTSLVQIISNLLSNAVNYLSPKRPGQIEITANQDDTFTWIAIKDNGVGIREEDNSKIFELFRRVGPKGTTGEGVGLNYVSTLVRRHGGSIRCDSTFGVGTTFHVKLPNKPSDEREEERSL